MVGHDHAESAAHQETEKEFMLEEKQLMHKLDSVSGDVEVIMELVHFVGKQVKAVLKHHAVAEAEIEEGMASAREVHDLEVTSAF